MGATIKEETGISRNTVIKNLDKTHPIGQADDAGKQKIIAQSTIDSFKKTVYKTQKEKQKKIIAKQKKIHKFVLELGFSHRSRDDA